MENLSVFNEKNTRTSFVFYPVFPFFRIRKSENYFSSEKGINAPRL